MFCLITQPLLSIDTLVPRLRSCVTSVTFAHPFLLAFRLMAKVTAELGDQ